MTCVSEKVQHASEFLNSAPLLNVGVGWGLLVLLVCGGAITTYGCFGQGCSSCNDQNAMQTHSYPMNTRGRRKSRDRLRTGRSWDREAAPCFQGQPSSSSLLLPGSRCRSLGSARWLPLLPCHPRSLHLPLCPFLYHSLYATSPLLTNSVSQCLISKFFRNRIQLDPFVYVLAKIFALSDVIGLLSACALVPDGWSEQGPLWRSLLLIQLGLWIWKARVGICDITMTSNFIKAGYVFFH